MTFGLGLLVVVFFDIAVDFYCLLPFSFDEKFHIYDLICLYEPLLNVTISSMLSNPP